MGASTAQYKFVFFHHPAYTSSSVHDASPEMRWNFEQWGATAVFQGHNHFYERMLVGNLTYLTIGSSGNNLYPFNTIEPNSQFRNNTDFGFLLIELDTNYVNYRFMNAAGTTLDSFGTPEPGTAILLLCAAPLLYAAHKRHKGKR